MKAAKSFEIPKNLVWLSYLNVKAKAGASGVDGESVEDFERDLKNNLYRLWNRMSSGTYFPPPVLRVSIPKRDGGQRHLGIPTVEDRIAQGVAKMYLEPIVEPMFHDDSYGYRPGKSALDAVGRARERCWKFNWVLDLDVKQFFDTLNHDLVMRAVRKYTDCRWVLLYVERWLTAPVQLEDGSLEERDSGTPQGGVISPLLANIFLHLAFDSWISKTYPQCPFERYADDVVVHCRSEAEVQAVRAAVVERLRRCKLEVHPEKTKVVYCKDANRRGSYERESFDFLSYTFRPRRTRNSRNGRYFASFSPAMSGAAAKRIRQTMRRNWKIPRRVSNDLKDLANMFNPYLRGWINYYGKYCRSELAKAFRSLQRALITWVMRKYKRFRGRRTRASKWMARVGEREPTLFAHWSVLSPA